MLPLKDVINSTRFLSSKIRPQSLISNPQIVTKRQIRRRRNTTIPTITRTSLYTSNTINKSISSSISISSTQQQQHISFEDPYSPKTGIKTASILGGMLALVIIYLMWKARARLCRSYRSSSAGGNSRPSAVKFDLDYWLKQVDLLEAKEAERNRGGQSLYLELPNQAPRDNREATASWIVDTYRHWRLLQYRQRQQVFRAPTSRQAETTLSAPYRRRRNFLRRVLRRYFTSRHNPSYLMEHSSTLIAGMRPSIVSNTFIPPLTTISSSPVDNCVPARRTNSWPRLKSSQYPTGASMSALQIHLARKRLLKRISRTRLDV